MSIKTIAIAVITGLFGYRLGFNKAVSLCKEAVYETVLNEKCNKKPE